MSGKNADDKNVECTWACLAYCCYESLNPFLTSFQLFCLKERARQMIYLCV